METTNKKHTKRPFFAYMYHIQKPTTKNKLRNEIFSDLTA